MACPTCGHTLHKVVYGIFWCPRCGTLMQKEGEAEVPKLVERCRTFGGCILNPSTLNEWRVLGIAESINLPENR